MGTSMRATPYFSHIATLAAVALPSFAAAQFTAPAKAQDQALTTVRIAAVAALSPSDSDYSERFKAGFQGAFFYAAGENAQSLRKCGYKVEFDFYFYASGDAVAPADASKAAVAKGAWLVVAPDRSNEALVAASAVAGSPMVSLLANSKAVTSLRPPFFTASMAIDDLARTAAKHGQKEAYGKAYGVAIDKTCRFCVDFAEAFETIAGKALEKKFEIGLSGESPELSPLANALKRSNVDFLMLPGYSKQSGYTIATLGKEFPKLKFVGGDGWGDDTYGYITKFPILPDQQGFAVRGGRSYEKTLAALDLGQLNLAWKGDSIRNSDAMLGIVSLIRKQREILCRSKPKSRESYIKAMSALPASHFRLSNVVSVLELKGKSLRYAAEHAQ